MERKTFRVLLVLICIALLFTGCRTRIIGDKNSADETTVNPEITTQEFRSETETTTENEEQTTSENTEVTVKENEKPNKSKVVFSAKGSSPRGRRSVVARRVTTTARATQKKTAKTTTKPKTTAKKKAHTTTTQPTTNAVKYSVSFDSNGGWGKTKSRKLSYGQTFGEEFPKVYNTRGYTFLGWFDSKSGGRQIKNTDRFTYQKDLTLYAHWSYDASVYWRNYLISANLYPCTIQKIYIEFEADNKTASSSEIITLTRSENAADNSPTLSPTDAQIKALGCDIIVKVVGDFENAPTYYNKMKSRFSYKPVYVLPSNAEFGTKDEKTYYCLLLSEIIYEKGFPNFDREKCSKELGISGSIYTKD